MQSKKIFNSIRARMVVIYVLITLAAFLTIGFLVADIVEDFLISQRTQQQTQQTVRVALEAAPDYTAGNVQLLYDTITARAQSMEGRLLVVDNDAVVQLDSASQSNGYRIPYREVRSVLAEGADTAYGFHRITRSAERTGLISPEEETVWAVYYAAPITNNGVNLGAVVFSALIQDVENSVRQVINQITVIFLVVSLIIAIVSLLVSNWLTKPIAELTTAIRSMGSKKGVSVKVHGAGEMAELAEAFNRMSVQIEDHDRIRDEFVANASHELKTPLSSMKILSESMLYQDDPDPAMAKEFFSDINNEVDRLSRIVTELLRLVREDVANAPLTIKTGRLDTLVERVMTRLQPLAAQKGVALTCDLVPVSCDFEPMRMEQVIVNLIENAIKYTDEGAVSITVSQEGADAVFSVADTGIGIPQEAIPKLFERFYRVDKARSRSTGGTGLGLAIVREIVKRHNGSIIVQSQEGKGSTFTVRIPLVSGENKNETE